MALIKGVAQRVISVRQLKLLKEFKSNGERTLWLREKGFRSFGRVTIGKVRHNLWFNPKLIRKDRVRSHFKKDMKNENQSK